MPVGATTFHQTLASNTTLTPTEFDIATFVEALRADLHFVPLGRRNDLMRGNGSVARWHRMANPVAIQTALTEGVDPTNSVDLDDNAVTATIATWGAYFELTDIFEIATISGTRQEFVKAAGYQAALTLDTDTQTGTGGLAGATNTSNAGTALKADDLRVAASALADRDAKPHKMSPGGAFFIMIATPAAAYDMIGEGAPTWYQARTQAVQDNLITPLDGTPAGSAVHGIIVKTSTNIQTSGGDDVMYVIGDDAFGVTSLESDILQPEVVVVPASPTLASPLGMRSTIGWKARYAHDIIQQAALQEVLADS